MPDDFWKITRAGRLRRLHALALKALACYNLDRPSIRYFTFNTNLFYKVFPASGEPLMLRLATPGWRSLVDLRSEAMWLNALRRETPIAVPGAIANQAGEEVFPVELEGIPSAWNATLMTWVPGRLLGHALNERNLAGMGDLFARLHIHGAAWRPPEGFTTRRFEHWLSRGEPNLIVGAGGEILVESPHSGLLARMHERVEAAYAAIDRSDLRVIHCDLWHDNIKLDRGVLRPFDFEDTVWGFRSHDIAMAMLDLLETAGEERYPRLLAAFKRGYEQHLSWPEDPIEPFQVGRLLWKVNWVARHQPEGLQGMIAAHAPVFEHFEKTGAVILPGSR